MKSTRRLQQTAAPTHAQRAAAQQLEATDSSRRQHITTVQFEGTGLLKVAASERVSLKGKTLCDFTHSVTAPAIMIARDC